MVHLISVERVRLLESCVSKPPSTQGRPLALYLHDAECMPAMLGLLLSLDVEA
jgi:hypothetical protein